MFHESLIAQELRVGGQEHDALRARLRDQHSVERVLVERRQVLDREGMQARDDEFFIAIVEQGPSQFPGIDRESSRCFRLMTISQRLAVLKTRTLSGSPKSCRVLCDSLLD